MSEDNDKGENPGEPQSAAAPEHTVETPLTKETTGYNPGHQIPTDLVDPKRISFRVNLECVAEPSYCQGGEVKLIEHVSDKYPRKDKGKKWDVRWHAEEGVIEKLNDQIFWNLRGVSAGRHDAEAVLVEFDDGKQREVERQRVSVELRPKPRPYEKGDVVSVDLKRSEYPPTRDEVLWKIIRNRTDAISFNRYMYFMDGVFLGRQPSGIDPLTSTERKQADQLYKQNKDVRFRGTDAYDLLDEATTVFLMHECGVTFEPLPEIGLDGSEDLAAEDAGAHVIPDRDVTARRRAYERELDRQRSGTPQYSVVRDILELLPSKDPDEFPRSSYGVLPSEPRGCLVELIWNYWHEEAMLVQTMNAISLRFQNRNVLPNGNPFRHLTTSPLRPLSNLLWGYVQNEQFRLSIARRAMGYAEEYGLPLYGRAVNEFVPVDTRSRFLESFHNLLYVCTTFFRHDDNKMMVADAFNVLNALKEVNLVLSYGANNEFGDLVWTARKEMLMQQWLLAFPEFQLFLGNRPMVPYPQPWMGRVDAARSLMGWGDTSVMYYSDLANFGEKILLSVRYRPWNNVTQPATAANWARAWRAEIQGYIHAYRTVTGVDLSAEVTDVRLAEERFQAPAALLLKRLNTLPRSAATARVVAQGPAESLPSPVVSRAAIPSRTP